MKKILLIIPIMLIMIIGALVYLNINNTIDDNKSVEKINSEDINVITQTFTLTDNSTELNIKVENLKDTTTTVNELEINLIDENNEIIKTYTKNINRYINVGESAIINITFEEKYTNVSEIKYKILN